MTDLWRRQAIQAELLRGSTWQHDEAFFGETNPGHVVDSAVFECEPCSTYARDPAARVRLTIQARVGVTIRTRRRLPQVGSQQGQLLDLEWPDNIALSAFGGRSDSRYFWVQIFSDASERITSFGGSTRTEDINRDHEQPNFVADGNLFEWAGRVWGVDSVDQASARYSLAQPTSGAPNCETLYDAPTSTIATLAWMRRYPEVERVDKSTQFHSFLYQVPLLPNERQRVFLPRLNPSASVAWSHFQTWMRASAGAEPAEAARDVAGPRYSVHYIHPNGVVPPAMNSVLWRVFHGR